MADSASVAAGPSTDAWDASAGAASEASVNASAKNYAGSPLCAAAVGHCSPDALTPCADDAGPAPEFAPDAGASPWLDAGTSPADGGVPNTFADGGAGNTGAHDSGALLACRVVQHGGATASQCTAAGYGVDGDACRTSSDCGIGFECVGSPGQCRRYCCGGEGTCSADRVCDKQVVVGSEDVRVPACVPIHPCKLLAKGCPDSETCGIADQTDGRTSCLAIGSSTAGESCEVDNCAAGFTCLGEQGQRTCYKLCQKSRAGDCPTDSKCRGTTPLFQDPDQGVCIKDIPSR